MTNPLGALYPGLRRQPAASREELLTSVRAKVDDSIAAKRQLVENQAERLIDMAEALAKVFRAGGRLFTMGNGGSASDAAHVAVEFNHPVTVGRPALPAHNLSADPQLLTALGNDVGFDQVFARPLASLGQAQDALLGLSTSGNSKNLLTAFDAAKRIGMTTLAFSGGDGGRLKDHPSVDLCLVAEQPSVHRVQECHLVGYHVLWDLVHTLMAQDRNGSDQE